MSRRARYDGPFEEVVVRWPPGETAGQQQWTVKRDGLLDADAPAALRDELTAGPDWTEVEQASGKKKED